MAFSGDDRDDLYDDDEEYGYDDLDDELDEDDDGEDKDN
jgi:hypothetical protein